MCIRDRAKAKIRSTGFPMDCTVTVDAKDRLYAVFDRPVKAATCGQSLVIYQDNVILAGGIIDSAGFSEGGKKNI